MALPHERQFSEKTVKTYFGPDSSAAASQLKRENPSLYAAIRAQAVADGRVGPATRAVGLAKMKLDFDERHAQPELTTEQLRARAAFSEEDCKSYLLRSGEAQGFADNLASMKRDNPEKFRLLKIAAKSYGLPVSDAPVAKPQAKEPEPTFLLAEPLRSRFHLPEGHQVTEEAFLALQRLAATLEAEAAEQNKNQNEGVK